MKGTPIRIAQVARLWESVPPQTYGGTELVVSIRKLKLDGPLAGAIIPTQV